MNEVYDQFLTTKLKEAFLLSENDKRVKTSFWPTDAEKNVFDLYHEWIGTPKTNPIEPEKLIMFNAAKMIEVALVNKFAYMGLLQQENGVFEKILKKLGLAKPKQTRIEMEREGVKITGYMDAVFVDGTPLEVKTFYGDYQAKELKLGKPKTAYLKQLAMYMDFQNADKGKLLYMDRGVGEIYEFTLTREGTKFKCMSVEFDITDTYKRFARLYNNNIVPKIEPKSEYVYKYLLEEIVNASNSVISAARTNKAVYGDWQVKYSPYKDLIIEREGCGLGYSDEEITKIKELTKGYSSKY